jgi:hypothetical protein
MYKIFLSLILCSHIIAGDSLALIKNGVTNTIFPLIQQVSQKDLSIENPILRTGIAIGSGIAVVKLNQVSLPGREKYKRYTKKFAIRCLAYYGTQLMVNTLLSRFSTTFLLPPVTLSKIAVEAVLTFIMSQDYENDKFNFIRRVPWLAASYIEFYITEAYLNTHIISNNYIFDYLGKRGLYFFICKAIDYSKIPSIYDRLERWACDHFPNINSNIIPKFFVGSVYQFQNFLINLMILQLIIFLNTKYMSSWCQ